MYKIIIYVIVIILLIWGYVKYIELRGIFFPAKTVEYTPAAIHLQFEDVYLTAEDGVKLHGWFIPHESAAHTLLFFHGNAGNIGHRLDKISMLHNIGINIFIFDYRGYGKSQGRPSEKGVYFDAYAAYKYLVNTRHVYPEQIILYGESLGTAVAIHLAKDVRVGALILEGAFSSGKDLGGVIYPFIPKIFLPDKFDSVTKIKEISAPKLFLHSTDDEIVPIALAKKLFMCAPENKYLIELSGGHNSAFIDSQDRYISGIAAFIGILKTRKD